MADSFRYNVIVDVAINPQTNQGKTQVRGALNQIEQEAKRSYQNMQRDHARSIQEQKRQIDSLVAHHNRAADAIAAKARYHQERFKAMQLQAVGLNTPANIRQQTQAQSNQQRLVSQYSTGSLNDALRSINNLTGSKIQLGEVEKKINDVSNATRKGAGAFGMWGQAFKGAFIGAVAGITFSTIISGITGIVRGTINAGVEAVKMAASYELVQNSMKVFTGSARSAKAELEQIANIAKDTPGLGLEDAEQGALRLRALGFEAKVTQDLVVGLAKQKLLSGADEQAISRVIVNIQQLSAGSPRVTQDIKEMVQNIPTLKTALTDAFGSVEKFKSALADDPEAAFTKFSKAIKNTEVAEAGLTDATTKLLDSVTQAGRKFGEPILDPLTEAFQDLTKYMYDNQATWSSWGQTVADTIKGASKLLEDYNKAEDRLRAEREKRNPSQPKSTPLLQSALGLNDRDYKDVFAFGGGLLPALVTQSQRRGEKERLGDAESRRQIDAITFGKLTDAQKEELAKQNQNERKAAIASENIRKKALQDIEDYGQQRISIMESQYGVERALAESADAFTLNQIQDRNKRISDLEQKQIKQQIANQSNYFDQLIALQDGDEQEIAKITLDRNEKISELNAKLRISEIEEARQAREDLRNILRQRRDDTIEFLDLESRSIQQALDKRSFDIERSLELETGDYNEHYRRLTEVTTDAYIEQSRVVREQLNLKLQDETLTDEQIVNLRTQTFLELQNLTEQNRQRTIQIEKRRLDQYVQETNRAVQQTERLFSSRSGQLGALGGLFSPESVASSRSGAAGNDFLKGIFEPITKIYEEGGKAINRLLEINELVGKLDTEKDAQELRDLSTEAKGLERVARSFQALGDKNLKAIPDAFEKIVVQSRELKTTADFDTLAKDVLTFQQSLESASLDKKIATINQQFDAGAISGKEFNEQIQDAFSDRTSLAIKQAAENAELYRNSLDGLRNTIKELSDPSSTPSLGLQRIIEGKSLQEAVSKIAELRETQFRVANPAYDEYLNKMDIEIAKGQDLLEFRNRETQAVIRSNRAKLEIQNQLVFSQAEANARLLEFFAEQKGITEIVSDAKINLLTSAYSGLESVVGRLTQRFGIFSDAIRETITSLIKLALNPFLRQLFGGGSQGASGGGGSFGGFGIPNIFGGGGVGGTPNFNPNFFAGGGNGSFGGFGGFGGGSTVGQPRGVLGDIRGSFGGLLGAGSPQSSSGTVGGTAQGSIKGILQGFSQNPFGLALLGGALGSSLGGSSVLGNIVGAIGGGLAPFTAGLSLLLLPFAAILGRNAARRRDEKTRNQAMIDALRGLDQILEGVNSDRIDGQSALQQAEQIRGTYVEQMSALKDKKTRRIALADVSRLDAKISQIKAAVGQQESRKQRLELAVPTFASGGSLGRYTNSNHVYNPQGYQPGGQRFGYFPNAGMTASFNERGSEYILDAETTRNVGVPELDKMRASRGKYIPAKYMGGLPSGGNNGSSAPIIENHITINQDANGLITVEDVKTIVKGYSGSEEQTANFVNTLVKRGGQPLNTLSRAIDSENKR